jgi:hypothetical protein
MRSTSKLHDLYYLKLFSHPEVRRLATLKVFETRILRRMFVLTRERRKLHTEEFNNSYSSPNIIRIVKAGKMGLAGHVARMGN